MTVYLLSYGRPHPAEPAIPVGVFSSREQAEAYATKLDLDNWELDEGEVDALLETADDRSDDR